MGMVDFLLVGADGKTVYVNPSRVNYIRPADSADAHTMIYFDKDHAIIVDHTPGDVARALSAP
jgi:hypothetical protein